MLKHVVQGGCIPCTACQRGACEDVQSLALVRFVAVLRRAKRANVNEFLLLRVVGVRARACRIDVS